MISKLKEFSLSVSVEVNPLHWALRYEHTSWHKSLTFGPLHVLYLFG
jgi:hypothetical protein